MLIHEKVAYSPFRCLSQNDLGILEKPVFIIEMKLCTMYGRFMVELLLGSWFQTIYPLLEIDKIFNY